MRHVADLVAAVKHGNRSGVITGQDALHALADADDGTADIVAVVELRRQHGEEGDDARQNLIVERLVGGGLCLREEFAYGQAAFLRDIGQHFRHAVATLVDPVVDPVEFRIRRTRCDQGGQIHVNGLFEDGQIAVEGGCRLALAERLRQLLQHRRTGMKRRGGLLADRDAIRMNGLLRLVDDGIHGREHHGDIGMPHGNHLLHLLPKRFGLVKGVRTDPIFIDADGQHGEDARGSAAADRP